MGYYKDILMPKKVKYPTPYFIRVKLGLLDWENYKAIAVAKNVAYSVSFDWNRDLTRGTGKTIRMLVNAVYYSQFRQVYLSGYNCRYTKLLVNQARDMRLLLRISDRNLSELPYDVRGRDLSKSYVFFDHYVDGYGRRQHLVAEIERNSRKPMNWV